MSHQTNVTCLTCLNPDLANQMMGGGKNERTGEMQTSPDSNRRFLRLIMVLGSRSYCVV